MKLIAIAAFSWAHAGIEVERFEPGQEVDTDDQDLIDTAVREGWATPEGAEVIAPAPDPEPDPVPDPAPAPPPAPEPDPAPAPAAPAAPAPAPAGRRKK